MTNTDMPTNWSGYDVPTLAAVLAEDHTRAWDQVTAWRTCYDLITSERSRIVRAAAELAESWPPNQSAASAAFLESVDMLTSSMNETAEAAIANSTAMSGVLTALAEAKSAVDSIHEEWQTYSKRDQLNARAEIRAAYVSVPTNWQDSLNAEAHRVMTTTDQVIFDNSRRLIRPSVLQTVRHDTFTPIPSSIADFGKSESTTHTSMSSIGGPGRIGREHAASNASEGDSPETISNASKPPLHGGIGGFEHVPNTDSSIDSVAMASSPILLSAAGAPLLSTVLSRRRRVTRGQIEDRSNVGVANETQAPISTPPRTDRSTESRHVGPEAEPMVPLGSVTPATDRTARKRRTDRKDRWQIPHGTPSVIEPVAAPEILHLPGPGVIGIDL